MIIFTLHVIDRTFTNTSPQQIEGKSITRHTTGLREPASPRIITPCVQRVNNFNTNSSDFSGNPSGFTGEIPSRSMVTAVEGESSYHLNAIIMTNMQQRCPSFQDGSIVTSGELSSSDSMKRNKTSLGRRHRSHGLNQSNFF